MHYRASSTNLNASALGPRQLSVPSGRETMSWRALKERDVPATSSGAVGMLTEGRGLDRGHERTKNRRRDTEEAA
jgi:hypothetical protein